MHEVGSEFAFGMRPVPRLPDGLINGSTHRRIDDSCNDFGPEDTISQRTRQCRRVCSKGTVRSSIGRARFHARAHPFLCARMASPHRRSVLCFFMRNPGGNAHDLAVASGVVRQPAAHAVSRASLPGRQRLRSWIGNRTRCAQRMDRFLGGHPV